MNTDTEDFYIPLIQSVKIREILWNRDNKLHHNRFVLEKLWEEVAEENHCSVREARNKWKTKRDQYRAELRKVLANRSVPEKSKWYYFSVLDFLRPQFEGKPIPARLLKKRKFDDPVQSLEEESVDGNHTEENDESFLTVMGNLYENKDYTVSVTSPDCDSNGTVKDSINLPEEIVNKTIARTLENCDDDLLFFESLRPHLKKVQGAEKLRLRNDIQNLVIKYAYS